MESVEVRRGGRAVLSGLDLAVPAGVITGLVGPSGCGKTTLMRAIVGVQVVTAGRIDVLGAAAGAPELRRRVAYVTQAPSVYGDLTVRENLAYFARILDVPLHRVDAAIATVGLERQARQLARTLSGGERSRCSLAVALLAEPDLLVLDEPTVGLDPVLREELWRTFRKQVEEGRAVLVSTHVMDEAARCDHLILMREGEIVAVAPPEELLRRTAADTLEHAFISLAEAA